MSFVRTALEILVAQISASKEAVANKITSWSTTPSDTKYSSEKLALNSFHRKATQNLLLPANINTFAEREVNIFYDSLIPEIDQSKVSDVEVVCSLGLNKERGYRLTQTKASAVVPIAITTRDVNGSIIKSVTSQITAWWTTNDAKYEGDTTFSNGTFIGLGYRKQYASGITFQKLKAKIWGDATTAVTVKAYTYNGDFTNGNMNRYTLLGTKTYAAGLLNQTANSFATIDFGSDMVLPAGNYLFICILVTSGTVLSMRYFDSTGTNPTWIYTVGTDFTNWQLASAQYHEADFIAIPSSNEKTLLMIGDSLTEADTTTEELHTLLDAYTPHKINPIGTVGTSPNKHEGHGGKTFAWFVGMSSPFWDGTRINLQWYLSHNALGSMIDVVTIQLGINDCFTTLMTSTQIAAIITSAKALIDAILNVTYGFPNCKIIIALPPICSLTRDGFGANYGNSYTKQQYMLNIRNLWAALITAFDLDAYGVHIPLAINGLMIDRLYNYQTATEAANARTVTILTEFTNGVHPSDEGYKQLADAFMCSLQEILSWYTIY
jgi:lysophospholipase L1-like esterase